MSVANGGSFKDGFVGGLVGVAVGAAFAGPSSRLGKLEGLTGVAARTTLAAVSGGVASKTMGGSFSDGAYSAAFFNLFNNEAHREIQYADEGFLNSGLDFGEKTTIIPFDCSKHHKESRKT